MGSSVSAPSLLTDELREQLGDVKFGGDNVRPGLFETSHTDDTYTEYPASSDFPLGEPRRFWRFMIEGAAPVTAKNASGPSRC